MILSFKLSMPGNNSWNGRWSGENKLYVRTRSFLGKSKDQAQKLIGSHGYNFGDGWRARIDVNEISSTESRKLNKKSDGFCGYEWMIDSLIKFGEIRT